RSRVKRAKKTIQMSASEELRALEKLVSRLRRRIENQAKHVEGLAEYPELAERATRILELESENLRKTLIEVQEMKARVAKEAAEESASRRRKAT
ncbi:MAG TPA: hypothetical protein VKB49_15935, partial [Candidatus Sulfotelmatobacter sp.]|nr:hypothetical protein [Candidatus Sulfotelmatobacter sp.]